MHHRSPLGAVALAITLCATVTAARAWDDAKYPDWKGQWERVGGGSFDTDKRPGRAQQPPAGAGDHDVARHPGSQNHGR